MCPWVIPLQKDLFDHPTYTGFCSFLRCFTMLHDVSLFFSVFNQVVIDSLQTTIHFYCILSCFVERNLNAPEIETRLVVHALATWQVSCQSFELWIAPCRCTLRCSRIPGQSPWTMPKFMQGLREFHAGGLPNVNATLTWLPARII